MEDRTYVANALAELTFKLLAGCHEKEEKLAKVYGLTQAEFRCLRQIHENENINNKEIAERMNLSASRLTRIIDGLVQKEYVIREIEPNDRRNMRVFLSAKGTHLVQNLNLAYIHIHEEILKNIDMDQHQPLIVAMKQLLSALEKWIAK
jgi:DNA-binding MarR family transcriptional regulator